MASAADIRVGTAGWSIPRAAGSRFDSPGTHLERYARRFDCAEINSSFHRPHAATTYAKWRASTPAAFRFSVKIPRAITHDLKLQRAREPLIAFLAQTDGLAEKRGPLLLQLPPSLTFDGPVLTRFLNMVRRVYAGAIVCEPRHATWFSPRVTRCWRAIKSRVLPLTLPQCRSRHFRPARRAWRISGCTAHRGRTGHATTRNQLRDSPEPSTKRLRSRCGACSITPPAGPPSRTPGSSVSV